MPLSRQTHVQCVGRTFEKAVQSKCSGIQSKRLTDHYQACKLLIQTLQTNIELLKQMFLMAPAEKVRIAFAEIVMSAMNVLAPVERELYDEDATQVPHSLVKLISVILIQ